MNKEWITGWKEEVGKKSIPMHSTTNTSKNMEVALGFSKCHTDYSDNQKPVLFVYSI